jgi:hypothetical protein
MYKIIYSMGKKVIINETTLKKIVAEQLLNESELSKTDVTSIVRDTIKNDAQVKRDIEKRVKELVAGSVNTLFKTLWQRRNFYEDEIKR